MSGQFEDELRRLIYAGAGVGVACLIEHLLCYDPEQYKRDPDLVIGGSNVLGVLTIAVGYGVAKKSVRAFLEVFTIAAVAAIIVIAIRVVRHTQHADRLVNYLAGRIEERIQGALDDDQGYARNGSRNIRA